MSDMVSSPPHYTRGAIEVWDFIADQELDYFTGNVVKYVCRAGYKGERLEDLWKARAYIDKAIAMEIGEVVEESVQEEQTKEEDL